jgi:hypothetical protein
VKERGILRLRHHVEQALTVCPYGAAGDRLWVRETWAGDDACGYVYRADHPDADLARGDLDDGEQTIRCWRPSIFMRRAALEVLSRPHGSGPSNLHTLNSAGDRTPSASASSSVMSCNRSGRTLRFKQLWDVINGKRAPWSSNAWVWRVEFRRLRP